MFGNRKRIEKLESEIAVFRLRVNSLEWEVKNPPKYMVGQIIGRDLKIVEVYSYCSLDHAPFNFQWKYRAFSKKKNQLIYIE